MDATHDSGGEQAALWNGPAGRAWVDTQELLDRVLKPFEDLLLDAVFTESVGQANDVNEILDVGCGTGSTTIALARRRGQHGHTIGVDISAPMIAAARARAERERAPADFICADAQVHAFEPARVDTIVSRFGVMFFDDPVAAFANLRRAATDDARLRFVAWRSAAENPFMTTAERAAAPFLPNLPPRRPDAPGQFAFADGDRVRRILTESGWSQIDVRPIDVDCALAETELLRYVTRLGPVGLVLQSADDRTRARIAETIRPAFDPYVRGDDVRFTGACWMVGCRVISRRPVRSLSSHAPGP
jgi:SAM-dependent methyltransferase